MLEASSITMKTLLFKNGRFDSIKMGREGNSWENVIPITVAAVGNGRLARESILAQ